MRSGPITGSCETHLDDRQYGTQESYGSEQDLTVVGRWFSLIYACHSSPDDHSHDLRKMGSSENPWRRQCWRCIELHPLLPSKSKMNFHPGRYHTSIWPYLVTRCKLNRLLILGARIDGLPASCRRMRLRVTPRLCTELRLLINVMRTLSGCSRLFGNA